MAEVETASRAAERAAREAYGRLLSLLSRGTRNIAASEDALSEAFAAALATWPQTGVPQTPEAWLLQVARRKLLDDGRRRARVQAAEPDIVARIEELAMQNVDRDWPDARLGLMFACAHPAIDPAIRTPLMLQTILGLNAARIAGVFMVPAATMSQRLVRAKTKIKAAGIPFDVPGREMIGERLEDVLQAVYGAYTVSYSERSGGESLAGEAEWLARLLVSSLPESGSARALLALILYSESRASARDGAYVPLSLQDTALWDASMLAEADDLMADVFRRGAVGRFEIEAAIQCVHAARRITGQTDHEALLVFYDGLLRLSPSLGAEIARAALLGEARTPHDGLTALAALPGDRVQAHAPFWATRARLLSMAGEAESAIEAYDRAIALTGQAPVRDWLAAQRARLLQ